MTMFMTGESPSSFCMHDDIIILEIYPLAERVCSSSSSSSCSGRPNVSYRQVPHDLLWLYYSTLIVAGGTLIAACHDNLFWSVDCPPPLAKCNDAATTAANNSDDDDDEEVKSTIIALSRKFRLPRATTADGPHQNTHICAYNIIMYKINIRADIFACV